MQWDLLFVQSTFRVVFPALCMLLLNVLAIWVTIYILKKKEFNHNGQASLIIIIIILLDYGYFHSFKIEIDVVSKFENGKTEIVEGKIGRCDLLRSNKGSPGAAEISVGNNIIWVDNFVDWHPCRYFVKGRMIRVTYVHALDSRKVAVKVETQRPS